MEYILGLLNLALLVMLFLKDKAAKEERNQFITALLSKTPQEYAVANRIIEQEKSEAPKPPEYVPETELSDEDFLKSIKKTVENG